MQQLQEFLIDLQPQTTEQFTWGESILKSTAYLSTQVPPLEFITSARAIVTRHSEETEPEVLVVRDPTSKHVTPGGRLETGETPAEATQREVLEETGWQVRIEQVLGFLHLHHLTPCPSGYRYPYPDFVWLIHSATPLAYAPEGREQDGYELGAEFVPLAQLDLLTLSAGEQVFLPAALEAFE